MKCFFDWDGTLTLKSSLPAIAAIGYSKNAGRPIFPWSHFAISYSDDYERLAAQRKLDKDSIASLKTFYEWQESLVTIERASIERIEKAGLFAGLTENNIAHAAAQFNVDNSVALRKGLLPLIARLGHDGNVPTILSINWSSLFIRETLLCNAMDFQEKTLLGTLPIRSNDIELESTGNLSRAFPEQDRGIWTAKDKLRIMKSEFETTAERPACVYVGDDMLDLPCLLEADVGICIRDECLSAEQQRLAEVLEEFGIECYPIWDWHEDVFAEKTSKRRLWWAADFDQILQSRLLRDPPSVALRP